MRFGTKMVNLAENYRHVLLSYYFAVHYITVKKNLEVKISQNAKDLHRDILERRRRSSCDIPNMNQLEVLPRMG